MYSNVSKVETSPHAPASVARGDMARWAPMLDKLLAGYDGAVAVRLPDGSSATFGRMARQTPIAPFTLCLRRPGAVRRLLLGRDPLRFAEAYFCGDIDVEGDLFQALSLRDHVQVLHLPWSERLLLVLRMLGTSASLHADDVPGQDTPVQAHQVVSHSRDENREAIAFHYDLSNAFYRLWLDDGMVYSCAYFTEPDADLESAQCAKLDHICRKLQLQPGDRFLDIGCGWGALVLHAARHYGVQAHGITLSQRQFDVACERIKEAGLRRQVTVALQDYRDLQGAACYDKISSVGMFEHVGLNNLPQYFDTVHRLLKPDGYFLNHGITHDEEGWTNALSSRFINRYVFPDGELDTLSNVQRAMERSKFEIMDVEGLRPHYAKTLRHWVQRLEREHGRALEFVNEATYRVWRLYMAASALEFESGGLGVYQILAGRRAPGVAARPLTRNYMYPAELSASQIALGESGPAIAPFLRSRAAEPAQSA